MTREEKINTLKAIIQECEEYQWQRKETLFEIIKDLEQETVSKEVYDHEYFLRKEFEGKIDKLEQVLDKIREEIKALSPKPTAYDVVDGNPVKDAIWETLIEVDKIIDKYKAESEPQESEDKE